MFRKASSILGLTLVLNLGLGCGNHALELQESAWKDEMQAANISLDARGLLEAMRVNVLVDAYNPAAKDPEHLDAPPAAVKKINNLADQCNQLYKSGAASLRQASESRIKDMAKAYFLAKSQWMEKKAQADCDILNQFVNVFLTLPQPPEAITLDIQEKFDGKWTDVLKKSQSLSDEALVLQKKADAIAAANPDLFGP